jgi:hypothetical protein
MSDVPPEDVDVATLPRISFEQLTTDGWECIDLDRGLYQGPGGDLYRSLYRRPEVSER